MIYYMNAKYLMINYYFILYYSLTETEDDGSKRYEKFLQKLNAWSLGLDLSQPPPAHLR
jgi:hypothetical protein